MAFRFNEISKGSNYRAQLEHFTSAYSRVVVVLFVNTSQIDLVRPVPSCRELIVQSGETERVHGQRSDVQTTVRLQPAAAREIVDSVDPRLINLRSNDSPRLAINSV